MMEGFEAIQGWETLLPEMTLAGGALLLLIWNILAPRSRGPHFAVVAMGAIGVAAYLGFLQWDQDPAAGFTNMVVQDPFGVFVRWVILAAAALGTLTAPEYLRRRQLDGAEFYALLLLSAAGMTLLAVSSDLLLVFLAIELLSLALYVMAGFERGSLTGQEASMKYFLLGAFGSAFLLYGIAFVYGATGTTNLLTINQLLITGAVDDFRLIAMGLVLLIVGLGFKASLVPFHMWTPDVYQGAPTPVTAFMAGGTKAAAFAAVLRIFVVWMGELRWDWRPPMAAIAVATMLLASVLAIAQTDVKRMLGYSSVAHAGFLTIAVVAATSTGVASALLYLLVYTAMTIGAFACVMLFREGDGERVHLSKYSGLGSARPFAAALFAFFLFSLAGIPPTGGFFAKFYVFLGAIDAGFAWLAVAGVLASVIAAFFYIRIAVVMFMQKQPSGDEMPLDTSLGLRVAIAICAAVVVAVTVAPGFFLSLAEAAVAIR